MRSRKKLTIGNVEVTYLSAKPDNSYSEAEAAETETEKQLLDLFRSPRAEEKRAEILAGGLSWPLRYHLSPQRGNIVSWYNFKPGATVLEVGAGPGAITEALVKKDIVLNSLELTERRSLINAYRNKASRNLKVLIGNLQDYKPSQKFDYVVCIGVLEYAGSFIDGEANEPYISFLRMLKNLLKPDGSLLLAIENRLGLKYWAGAAEDHTGDFFAGLNAYPGSKRVQTFSRRELTDLLSAGGFSKTDFYYPFPDYKMPLAIFSDSYLPGEQTDFPVGLLPTPTPGSARENLFSEQAGMLSLQRSGLFGEFSNSFLVAAK